MQAEVSEKHFDHQIIQSYIILLQWNHTHIMQPIQFPPLRIGSCVALEVHVVTFFDVIR